MMKRMLSASVLVLMVTVATASAQKVTTDSDPAAPFASYKTYAWATGTPSPNPLGEQRIHDGVMAQLAAKGLVQANGTPDLYVSTHMTAHEEKELVSSGFGYGPWWGGGGYASTSVHTYIKGTLLVDLYDAKSRKLIWRGTAVGTASDKASKNAEKLNKALNKMFAKYPA